MPGVLAFVFGWFAFRSRVTGVYLSIITQALTYALMLAFFRNDMGFGGNNGLTDFKDLLGFPLQRDGMRVALMALSALALALGYLACRYIVTSRAGRVVEAVRDAESRTRFIGYSVESYKLWLFVFSAVLAGIAGALYVPQVGIINPSEFSPINSIEVVIWVAVGGRGVLYGAVAGAVLVNYAKTVFTGALPEFWLYALGALFVLVTLFLPKGVVGLHSHAEGRSMNAAQAWRKLSGRSQSAKPPPPPRSGDVLTEHGPDARAGCLARHDPVSRRHHRQLRWLQGAQRAHAVHRQRRAPLHHRPERRRQDDDDGRDHRQDAPGLTAPPGSARRSTC